jgi:hypothetical protein
LQFQQRNPRLHSTSSMANPAVRNAVIGTPKIPIAISDAVTIDSPRCTYAVMAGTNQVKPGPEGRNER